MIKRTKVIGTSNTIPLLCFSCFYTIFFKFCVFTDIMPDSKWLSVQIQSFEDPLQRKKSRPRKLSLASQLCENQSWDSLQSSLLLYAILNLPHSHWLSPDIWLSSVSCQTAHIESWFCRFPSRNGFQHSNKHQFAFLDDTKALPCWC